MNKTNTRKKMILSNAVFKRLFGVKPGTFKKMLSILQKNYDKNHKFGGRPPKLSVEDKLIITLKYLREYRTMENIGYDYGVSKSTVCESIQWVENTLKKDSAFKLPGKKVLKKATGDIEYVVVDVTESPTQRPKKKQHLYYSGKKKQHTIKTQIVIDGQSKKILYVSEGYGSEHDFSLYKRTMGTILPDSLLLYADLGYLGIHKLHAKSEIPHKASKFHPLTDSEKDYNKRLSRKRIVIEHVNAQIKTFKCMAYPYRNHCRRHLMRMSIICAIINLDRGFL